MKFRTPRSIEKWFYLAVDTTNNAPWDEQFGLCFARFYVGIYEGRPCAGFLDDKGVLRPRRKR